MSSISMDVNSREVDEPSFTILLFSIQLSSCILYLILSTSSFFRLIDLHRMQCLWHCLSYFLNDPSQLHL